MNEQQEKKWEEKFEKWLKSHPRQKEAAEHIGIFVFVKEAYLQACRDMQEEIEEYKLIIKELIFGLDDFWMNTSEGKTVREKVRKLFKEAK